jgi:CubicO group peptidase (beta-lactamase class C family)
MVQEIDAMNPPHRIFAQNNIFAAVLAAVLVLAGSAPVPAAAGGKGAEAARLDPIVRALFDAGLTPGMQVAVVKDREIVYTGALGVADLETGRKVGPETRFYIASTTKAFTAQAAASLAAKGTVDLDVPIARYLPSLHLKAPLSADSITLRDLLTHTHGIDNEGPLIFVTAFTGDYEPARLPRLLEEHGPAKNGREFSYGNIGYVVGGMVLEAATGKTWKELVETEVLTPAGMTHTTAYRSRAGDEVAMPHRLGSEGFERLPFVKTDASMNAAGGHVATATDLARFLTAHLDRGRIGGESVFPETVIQETHRQQATQDRKFGVYHRYGWGLGWDLATYEADTLTHRFGTFYGGFFSHASFMPERGIGVVVLLNEGRIAQMSAEAVANAIYDVLLEKPGATEKWLEFAAEVPAKVARIRGELKEERERRAARPQETAHPLSAYAGEYENELYGRMVWTVEEGRLTVRMGALVSDTEVYNGAQDQIRVELLGSGQVVTFECEGEKAVALRYSDARFGRR